MFRRYLKIVPLVLLALLFVAWIGNFFGEFGLTWRSAKYDYVVGFQCGSLFAYRNHDRHLKPGFFCRRYPNFPPEVMARFGGGLHSLYARLHLGFQPPEMIYVPILLMMTLVLPLAVGGFNGFRFRLWHFFVFTTLVAVELVYFTRPLT